MALSLRNIVRIRYGITGSFSIINDVLSRARHDFGQGIARTPNGISLRLLLEALRVNPPGIPTQVTAVAGDAQATVFWQAPSSDGGSPIFRYNIAAWDAMRRIGITGTTTDGNARSAVCCRTPLTNGVPYFFRVWATNAAGDGFGSDSNTVTPMPAGPSGVGQVALYNCHDQRRTVYIWVNDLTAQTGWQQRDSLPPQYDDGSCPAGNAQPVVISLANQHVYQIIAVDPENLGCDGQNDPTIVSCQRSITNAVGASNGPVVTFLIS